MASKITQSCKINNIFQFVAHLRNWRNVRRIPKETNIRFLNAKIIVKRNWLQAKPPCCIANILLVQIMDVLDEGCIF